MLIALQGEEANGWGGEAADQPIAKAKGLTRGPAWRGFTRQKIEGVRVGGRPAGSQVGQQRENKMRTCRAKISCSP